ncbi:MAG: UDP-N-acetylmuramate dehydrogenase [Bacteroidales bacterium]|jgi:UDP-N-acetylmuramate dehydrogenase
MIHSNFNLKALNTFGLDCNAKTLIDINNQDDLSLINHDTLSQKNVILGGGSNVVFVNNSFDGTVICIQNKGIKVVEQDEDYVILESFAGEVWNDFVIFCSKNNWWGLENLSAVPGNVGAVAVQNIGAYGAELKDCFLDCLTYNPITKEWKTYTNEECKFGYRYSIFKYQKELEIIWKVRFKLSKKQKINISYSALKDCIEIESIRITSPLQICELVTKIRNSKLPDPKVLGNAGSFFKNPIINEERFNSLKEVYPNIPSYPAKNGVKLSAGWLIEECGWKGKRVGNVGMHEKQALVMVNYGNAKGEEIVSLANEIINSIKNKFNIELEIEVHIIN